MKITTFWLTVILGLALIDMPAIAQKPTDKPSDDAAEEASKEKDGDEAEKDGDDAEAATEETADAAADADAETETAEEVVEKSWEDRLVPLAAVSGQEPALEVVVGEPSASTGENAGEKIYLPYPPRPRSSLPPGWVLRPSDELPPITRNVKLADGRSVVLEFPTMELQPAAPKDGSFSMQEPGFDPRKASQENTISTALTQFIDDTTKHRDVLGEALREMEQVLLSAPAAPPRAAPASDNGEPSSLLLPPSPPTE